MTIFIDTSAFYAILDAQDANHARAGDVMRDLAARDADLLCTNYVLLESTALVQRRLGIAAVRTLHEDIVPLLRIEWLSTEEHQAAVQAVLTANRRELSLVDCTSFDAMRRLGIRQVFAFDEHFSEQGFECLA